MLRTTIELLLKGEFICPFVTPKAYQFLSDPDDRKQVEDILQAMGRKVSQTANGNAFFATWVDIGDNERKEIKAQFQQLKALIRPAVEFILLTMECNLRDNPLGPGDQISEAQILSKLQNDNFLAEKAYWLNQYINRRKSNDPLPQVLKAIFDFMKKNDIIYEQIPNSRKFTITGKIDYIYEVLSYIDSHEQILDESTPKIIQEELF